MANEMMSVEGQLVGMPLAGPESFSQQQLDYLKRALGVDETVLWSGNLWDDQTTTANLSEAASNFEYIRVYGAAHEQNVRQVTAMIQGSGENYIFLQSGNVWYTTKVTFGTGSTTLVLDGHNNFWLSGTTMKSGTDGVMIKKLVGVHRIAGGN